MPTLSDTLSVALSNAPTGCVAYVRRLDGECQADLTHVVTISYCEHVEKRRTRCPDGGTCLTSHPYSVRVCAGHEALIREWLCYVSTAPIGGAA